MRSSRRIRGRASETRCADVYDTADEHMQRPVGSCSGAAYNDEEEDEDGGDAG